jgi:hypothetical protein
MTFTCPICGRTREFTPSRINRQNTCGRDCQRALSDQFLDQRFWAKVNTTGPLPESRPDLGPCWLWTAALNNRGYGTFRARGRPGNYAHRFAYELLRGPIPDGLELDHLCRTPRCVNPEHLEPVTHRVNSLRSDSLMAKYAQVTHCVHGHLFDEANTHRPARGGRHCLTCAARRQRSRLRKERGMADSPTSCDYPWCHSLDGTLCNQCHRYFCQRHDAAHGHLLGQVQA